MKIAFGLLLAASIQNYIRSAQRFADIVRQAGADVILSNHTEFDGSRVSCRCWRKAHPALRIHT